MKTKSRFLFLGLLGIICLLGVVFPYEHPHFWWQKIPLFDAFFGFVGCIAIIFVSKWLGHRFLMRDENYYD